MQLPPVRSTPSCAVLKYAPSRHPSRQPLAVVLHPNGKSYLVGLCESNYCMGGAQARKWGMGRLIVMELVRARRRHMPLRHRLHRVRSQGGKLQGLHRLCHRRPQHRHRQPGDGLQTHTTAVRDGGFWGLDGSLDLGLVLGYARANVRYAASCPPASLPTESGPAPVLFLFDVLSLAQLHEVPGADCGSSPASGRGWFLAFLIFSNHH